MYTQKILLQVILMDIKVNKHWSNNKIKTTQGKGEYPWIGGST